VRKAGLAAANSDTHQAGAFPLFGWPQELGSRFLALSTPAARGVSSTTYRPRPRRHAIHYGASIVVSDDARVRSVFAALDDPSVVAISAADDLRALEAQGELYSAADVRPENSSKFG
jgi:hypothetical protein